MRGGYIITGIAVVVALFAVVQIHSAEHTGQQPYVAAGSAAPGGAAQVPAPDPALTAAGVAGPLRAVLGDLRRSDAARTEAWIAEGYSSDLQALVDYTDSASGTNPLNVNARVLSTDGYAYLADNSGGLQPGWRGEYAQLRTDLNTLAADTGLAPVPAPPDSYGLSAKPDTALPWQPPPQPAAGTASACTDRTTVTNSSSSTGAHSQSVKTTAKCGTATTSVTNKTSVSAKGTVTNTVTTSG
jgi:hypothetical protein